jgi:ABC-type glycerol-3-phosphate transport system permease component
MLTKTLAKTHLTGSGKGQTNNRLASIIRRLTELSIHLTLLALGFVYLFPFLWTLGGALKTPREFFTRGLNALPGGEWQWQNFADAWERASFGQYFLNTIFIALGTVFFTVLLTSMSGYAFSRLEVPFKMIGITIIWIFFLIPDGYSILPVYRIVKALGLLNTLWAVILVRVAGGMLFNSFLFYGFFRGMPKELEEASIIDGANVPQRFFYVMLPLAKPMIATVALFTFLGSWNDFFTPLVFTLGRPELRTLAVGMYAFVSENTREWTLICAGAAISLVPIIILFIFLQRYFVDAYAAAVKS